jgi:signal-transduction protein with cAMP-binding, CBS, and nucleotidyltransferase domain
VWLYLEQIPFFQDLPPVVKDTILSQLRTTYYKAGDCIHSGGPPAFLAVVFLGSVQWRVERRTVVKEKNEVILPDAFQGRPHDAVYCR